MRLFLSVCLISLAICAFPQFRIVSLESNHQKRISTMVAGMTLPFWDDFSAKNTLDTLLWMPSDVFVNSTLARDAPTFNVVTFDGLTASGAMHGADQGINGPTDSLVSRPIILDSSADDLETFYLSFFWQGKGNGERPDDEDSLVLDFKLPNGLWEEVWKKTGAEILSDSTFTQEILKVNSTYFGPEFQFRFTSYGRPSGPFDTWHLDYIYLNKNRTATDVSHFDRALSGSPSTPFGNYSIIPAEHFFRNPSLLRGQSFMASNLDSQPNPLLVYADIKNLTLNENYGTFPNPQDALLPFEYRVIPADSSINSSIAVQPTPLDSQVLEVTYYMDSGDKFLFEEVVGSDTLFLPVNLKMNDTIRSEFLMHNYYAYDDGTAEYAAGLNERNSKLAIKYVLTEQDTLTHIDIHFPTITPEAVSKTVNIIVWRKLFPQEQIVQFVSHSISANNRLNEFQRVKLATPVIVKDTIYIGFQQIVQDYVPVGFDRSNPMATGEIYSKTGREWSKNERLIGAFMIRPVFTRASDFVLSQSLETDLNIFPNPTTGLVKMNQTFDAIDIVDLSGKVTRSGTGNEINLSGLTPGMYVIRLSSGSSVVNRKLILKR